MISKFTSAGLWYSVNNIRWQYSRHDVITVMQIFYNLANNDIWTISQQYIICICICIVYRKTAKLFNILIQVSFDQVKVGPSPFSALRNLWRNLHMFLDILELRVESKTEKFRHNCFANVASYLWMKGSIWPIISLGKKS